MAFPTGWARKCTITIPDAQIAGSNSNFPILITEAMLPTEMLDGGTNSALNGGGDVRVTEDVAGAIRLPLDIVTFVTGGVPSVEMHAKLPTLNTGGDKTFTVWYNKSGETQPAVTDTYGRNAVWADYLFISHDGITDSTGNRTISEVGSPPTVAGNFGSDVNDYDGSSDYAYTSVSGVDLSGPISLGTWFEADAYSWQRVLTLRDSADDGFCLAINNGDGRVNLAAGSNNSATVWGGQTDGTKAAAIGAGWNFAQGVISATDGSSDKTVVRADLNGVAMALAASDTWYKPNTNQINIANRGSGNSKHNGRIGLSYIYLGELSQDWITTEYNNQSAPATFATAGPPEAVGGGSVLIINDGLNSQSTDQILIEHFQSLSVNISGHSQSVDLVSLTQGQSLAINRVSHNHTVGAVVVNQFLSLAPHETFHAHSLGNVSLNQGQGLAVNDALHIMTSGVITIDHLQSLITFNSTHGLSSDIAGLFDTAGYTPNPRHTHNAETANRKLSAADSGRKISPTNNRTLRI